MTYGDTEIAYRIERSARRKTVAVRVAPGQGVVLTAPTAVPVSRLDRVVHDKARWIVDRLRQVADVEAVPAGAKEMVSGESLLYLGRHYRLRVDIGAPGPVLSASSRAVSASSPALSARPARLISGWLRVAITDELTPDMRPAVIRVQVEAWYKARALDRLPARVALWSERAGLTANAVLVRAQAKRWGSCDSAGNLRFNWRIMQAPMALVDYVVAHEVMHLRHPEHTAAFWSALGALMPDYEHRRAELRQLGPRLAW